MMSDNTDLLRPYCWRPMDLTCPFDRENVRQEILGRIAKCVDYIAVYGSDLDMNGALAQHREALAVLEGNCCA